MDGRFALDDPKPIVNSFTLRKLRPTLTGRLARYFDFKIMPDFGNGATVVQDAYLDIRFSPKFRVRTGKDKVPVGYEWLLGDAYTLLPERTLVSSLVPTRDVGVQLQGDLSRHVSYAAGIFNGTPDGTTVAADVDTNSAKDVAARVVVRTKGLGFHLGGSRGQQAGTPPSFRTSAGQIYFSYAPGVSATGIRTRISPAVFYYYKAFGAFGEYVRSAQPVVRAGVETDATNSAWELTGSIVLTGEATSERGVRPKNNFDPAAGQWGAVQLVGRYAVLAVDRDIFAAGLPSVGSSRVAKSFELGVNWYPSSYVKYYVTFSRVTFRRDAVERPAEHAILFRAQLAF
jgi:phosphate-selective porin OprO/OprP